jgi:obg-like ATPase 1
MARPSELFFLVDLLIVNHRLVKIKAWIDANNPGDPLIPFSVSLEERLSSMTPEDKAAAEKEAAPSALGKIMHAGYSSLEVSAIA